MPILPICRRWQAFSIMPMGIFTSIGMQSPGVYPKYPPVVRRSVLQRNESAYFGETSVWWKRNMPCSGKRVEMARIFIIIWFQEQICPSKAPRKSTGNARKSRMSNISAMHRHRTMKSEKESGITIFSLIGSIRRT